MTSTTGTTTSQHSFPFGRRYRWLRRIVILVVLLVLCAWGFAPELDTVIWHLRNGRTADFAGMRLRVPFWSYAIVQPRSCTIIQPAGVVRMFLGKGYHHSSFRIESTAAPDALHRLLEARVGRGEMRRAGDRRTALLGAMMTCSQYDTPDGRGVTIECLRGAEGPAPYYSGPAGSEQQFYNLLASATSVTAPTSADAP